MIGILINLKLNWRVLLPISNNQNFKFLFISKSDLYGGGSIAAYRLHRTLCSTGYLSKMVVLNKYSEDESVIELKPKFLSFIDNSISNKVKYIFNYRIGIVLRKIYKLFYQSLKITGREVFFYPATYKILNQIDFKPDFICLYNISEGFFDLKILKDWSQKYYIIYSLQDLWIFTGHCGVPIDCDKLQTECFSCPDLNLPPKINFDKTKKNFSFKRKIINSVPINYLAPSKWVHEIALKCITNSDSSINLLNNAIESKFFKQKQNVKKDDGIFRIVTSAVGFKFNPYKDLETILSSVENISKIHKIKLIVIGEKNSNYPGLEYLNIDFYDHIYEFSEIINIYKKCDVLIHSSNIETWGFTVTEALSLGIPVIASNVGGLKDQVKGLNISNINNSKENIYNINEANGFLFEKNNINQLSYTLKFMIENKIERIKMSENAKIYAEHNYNLKKHVDSFVDICINIKSNQKVLDNN